MTDGSDSRNGVARSDRSVESLASQALDFLAKRRFVKSVPMSEEHVISLSEGVLRRSGEIRSQAVSEMRAAGVTLEDIVDHYIPEVARRLGRLWCEDQLGFADVTIGSARLQGLVRDVSVQLEYPQDRKHESGVAVVVLTDEFHTLGAMVMTTQLRRMGISVRLMLGVSEALALGELRQDRYDAVFISASHTGSLENLSKFVDKIRKQTKRNTPIVVGGPIIGQSSDVKAATGADVATSDVYDAVRACRLKTFHANASAKLKST